MFMGALYMLADGMSRTMKVIGIQEHFSPPLPLRITSGIMLRLRLMAGILFQAMCLKDT